MNADNPPQPGVIPDETHRLASPSQIAAHLHTTVDGLGQMRYRREGPPYIKIGHKVLYRWVDVHAWVAAHVQGV